MIAVNAKGKEDLNKIYIPTGKEIRFTTILKKWYD